MTDDEAIYRAILADPADDLPRLAFADWLDENGPSAFAPWGADDPAGLAYFIRTQVEMARRPAGDRFPLACRYADARYQAGWQAVYDWADATPPAAGANPRMLQWDDTPIPFDRGFPAAVLADDGRTFLDHADDLFDHYPIEKVAFRAIRIQEARPLAGCRRLGQVTHIWLSQGVSSGGAGRLFDSPHLGRLRSLHVGPEMTVVETARALVRSPAFARLTALSCRDDRRAGGSVVEELSGMTNPPRLERLTARGNRLDADRLERLVGSPALAAVAALDLGDNHIGPAGARVLAAGRFPHLRTLGLDRTGLGAAGVEAVAGSAFAAGLRELSLAGNALGADAAERLARSAAPGGLLLLDLSDNRAGDAGAVALAGSPAVAGLLALDLASNGVGDAGAAALADSEHLGGVLHLDLTGNRITPPAADRLRARFGDRVMVQ